MLLTRFPMFRPIVGLYQAVDRLATAGIINGYPDGTFKGQNNITRYEMAQNDCKRHG